MDDERNASWRLRENIEYLTSKLHFFLLVFTQRDLDEHLFGFVGAHMTFACILR